MASGDSTDDDDGQARTFVRDPLSGAKLGEFIVGTRLGEGGMGIVYRGEQPIIGRAVAIKVMKRGISGDGLLAEARALASVRHPNIIDIFGFGETPTGQSYFVMELLHGQVLDAWLQQHRPSHLQSVSILKQLFSALAAAHAANIVHRDLKPANVFLVELPEGGVFVKILDFGLAKRVDPDAPEFTRGRVGGTPLYMSPEQVRGQLTGPFTDLYSAGCIAWELFNGKPPYFAPTLLEMMGQHLRAPTPPVPPGLPEGIPELLVQLLEKEPAKRPASAMAVKQVLDRVERKLLVSTGTSVGLPKLSERATPEPIRPLAGRTQPEVRPTEVVASMALPKSRAPWLLLGGLTGLGVVLAVGLRSRSGDEVKSPPPAPVVKPEMKVEAPPTPVEAPAPELPPPPVKQPQKVKPRVVDVPVDEPRARPRLDRKLAQLEERVMLELVEDRQRMALRELKELEKEAASAPGPQVREMLREFEATWLKR
ncbi:MAG: serine/threonine-protein kinase [Archangium sp.]